MGPCGEGQRNEAAAVLRQILKDTPQNGEAQLLLGSILRRAADHRRCNSGN